MRVFCFLFFSPGSVVVVCCCALCVVLDLCVRACVLLAFLLGAFFVLLYDSSDLVVV